MVLPSGKTSRVKAIDVFEGERDEAFVPESVIASPRGRDRREPRRHARPPASDVPRVTRTFDAHLVWLHETPLDPGKSYFIKHTTQTSRVNVERVHWKKDLDTLGDVPAETLALNEIGRVTLTAHRALFVDGYATNRETGSFILIDSITNATVAAGMVIADGAEQDLDRALEDARRGESGGTRSQVSARERRQRFGVAGGIVLLAAPAGRAAALAYARREGALRPRRQRRAAVGRGRRALALRGAGRGRRGARSRSCRSKRPPLEEQRARAAADEERLLVVEATGAVAGRRVRRVTEALTKRGWLGVR